MMDVDLEPEDWRERDKVKSRIETFDGAFQGQLELILLSRPGFDEAMELVQAAVSELGRKITPQATEQLVTAFDRKMSLIRMEIEKLYLHDPTKECIDIADLSEVTASAAENNALGLV